MKSTLCWLRNKCVALVGSQFGLLASFGVNRQINRIRLIDKRQTSENEKENYEYLRLWPAICDSDLMDINVYCFCLPFMFQFLFANASVVAFFLLSLSLFRGSLWKVKTSRVSESRA